MRLIIWRGIIIFGSTIKIIALILFCDNFHNRKIKIYKNVKYVQLVHISQIKEINVLNVQLHIQSKDLLPVKHVQLEHFQIMDQVVVLNVKPDISHLHILLNIMPTLLELIHILVHLHAKLVL